jgi:uncharacterized Zn finger protein (UPF0148 family)
MPVAPKTPRAGLSTLQFPCQNCGAVLKYAPGTEHLTCEYCGTENQIELKQAQIEEYDLQRALESLPESQAKATALSIHCDECGAGFQFEAKNHAGECPFCGAPIVAASSEIKPIQPKSLLPFSVDETAALRCFQDWVNTLWFAPDAVKRYARSDSKLNGVYLPFWTFDSHTTSQYSGERGDVYCVQERVEVIRNNRVVTELRNVPKIRWTPVTGQVRRFFDDVIVGASNSLPRKILDALQPWDLQALVPYDEQYLSGFRSEYYQVDLADGFERARQIMDNQIYLDICRDIGGDHQRIYQVNTRHSGSTYKHCLLPVWFAAFRYRDKAYRFVVNGRTGKVQGERPYSLWKIAFTTLAALLLAAGIWYYLQQSGAFENLQPLQYPSQTHMQNRVYLY